MSTAPAISTIAAAHRPLAVLVYFESDRLVRRMLTPLNRFRRVAFEGMDGQTGDQDKVLLVSEEWLLRDHYSSLRGPNIRIIGVSPAPFRDARLDGAIYGYLPPDVPLRFLERMIDNAVDHIHALSTRMEINEKLHSARKEINELNQIGAALSAEHDLGKLLELILTKSREITNSDAGAMYLVEEVLPEQAPTPALPEQSGKAPPAPRDLPKRLRFKLVQNDTVQVPFRESTMEINERSIAGYVALTGKSVTIADAYRLADVPYSINRKFDEDSGYRTKSILAVPMHNQRGDVVGVVQLINAKRNPQARLNSLSAVIAEVLPYSERHQQIIASLASQAAVAIENSKLYEDIQKLFEGFVKASVLAIESRDPTTSGHSSRVANLTVALAEAVDHSDSSLYRDISFSRTEMREIRYASLLHDFGKVGVREEVLVKAKKLYPQQLELVKQRFHFVKRSMQVEALESRLKYLLERGREEYLAKLSEFDRQIADQLAQVDDYFQFVLKSNEPTVLPEGSFEKLLDIAAHHFQDFDGEDQALLNEDEVRLLSIRKGSLDDAERRQIESHVVHSFNFLQKIPWTKEIRNIPYIARGHHEKMNGQGYPYKLSAPEIPLQTRMMTISDIFDALAAADRPYKKAVTEERALEILGYAVKDGEIDGDLFRVFLDAHVFDHWKKEPFAY